MATTRTTKTITETEKEAEEQAELQSWLAQLAATAEFRRVHVYKKNPAGKWTIFPRFALDPTGEQDITAVFASLGDGEYKFVPEKHNGRFHGARYETVGGFGPGSPASTGATHGARGRVDMGEILEQLKEEMEFSRTMMLLDDLRDRQDQRHQRNAPPPAESEMTPEEREALHAESFKRQIETFSTIATLIRPKDDNKSDQLLATVLNGLVSKVLAAPEPTDRLLDSVGKILELKDKLTAGSLLDEGLGDWKTLGLMLLAGVMGNPQIRDALSARLQGLAAPPGAPKAMAAMPEHVEARREGGEARASVSPEKKDGIAPATLTAMEQARQLLTVQVWPLVKRAALAGSERWETYAELIDEQMPGFLDMWTGLGPEGAVAYLGQFDPEAQSDERINRWLLQFHHYLTTEEHGDAARE